MGEPARIHPPPAVEVVSYGEVVVDHTSYYVEVHLPSLHRSGAADPGVWFMELTAQEARALAVALIEQAEGLRG